MATASSSGGRLFLADPGLSDARGHHLTTALRLAEAAAVTGTEAVTIGNRRAAEFLAAIGAHPGFADSIYDPRPPRVPAGDDPRAVEATLARPAADLLALIRDWRIGPQDTIYFHTLTPDYAGWLLEATALIAPARAPRLAMMFRYDPETEPWVGRFDRLAAALARAERRGPGGRIALYAETADLAAFYAAELGRPVHRLDHFHSFAGAVSAPPPRPENAPPTVVYLGEARAEKGFDAFVAALQRLADSDDRPNFRFDAQAYFADQEAPAMAAAANRLRALAGRLEGTVHGVLEEDEYARLLAAADVVVVPHRLPAYKRRGSAIFTDALACGAVVVVRAGTSMSRMDGSENVVIFDDDDDLAGAICGAAIRARAAPRSAAGRPAAAGFSAATQIAAVMDEQTSKESGDDLMAEHKPTALVITRFWPQTGAAHVFRAQVAMLQALGFDVSVATVTSYAPDRELDADTYQWYCDQMELPPVTFHWVCFANADMIACMDEIAHGITGTDQSWTAETLRASATELPASLKQASADNPPDLILCNYLSHLPLASRLKGPATKIVVETHDICSVQYAATHDRPLPETDYRAELSAGRVADGLVFINPDEAEAFAGSGIDTPALTVLPACDPVLDPSWSEALASATAAGPDRLPLVDATRTMLARLIGSGQNPAGAIKAGIALRRAAGHGRLLLYLGSDHEWNLRGLAAFLDTVFIPHLGPTGHVLVVAGSASKWLAENRPDLAGVVRAGILPDLRPLLEARAVMVLPVLGGTGFPIKTLDALASGLPVVGTPAAFRGLDPKKFDVRVVELPEMAAAIRTLTEAPFQRRKPAPVGFAEYCRSWAGFLADRIGRKLDLPGKVPVPMTRPVAVDEAVTATLTRPEAGLTPIPRGTYEVSPETLPVLTRGGFGFAPRPSETHWLWSASWYFGFLLGPDTRGATLRLTLSKVRLPDWITGLDLDVFIDGFAHRIALTPETRVLDIPLFDVVGDDEAPVLVEIFLPDAKRMSKSGQPDDTRVLALCLTAIEIADIRPPLVIRASEIEAMTDRDFVTFAFERILGKAADEDGLAHYATVLAQGTSRREVIATLASGPDSAHPEGVVVG